MNADVIMSSTEHLMTEDLIICIALGIVFIATVTLAVLRLCRCRHNWAYNVHKQERVCQYCGRVDKREKKKNEDTVWIKRD